ncbi:uncharacterized protein [Euwallacea similis]|uniref:uncharacterized protein n=1 Tax=Euwallacea similis TaxID=1736056 RepID=UPI00344BA74E
MSCKTESFRFQRTTSQNSSGSSTRSNGQEHCRKRLKDKFDECSKDNPERCEEDGNVLSVLNLSETRRYLRNGAERLSRTFHNVRVTLGTLSQRFKTSTKRRQILEEGPMTPNPNTQTPFTMSKQVLGRTPTKMYSPFGIDSPYNPTTIDKENVPMSFSILKK